MYVSLEQALSQGRGDWRSFTCPEHEDANPSARVNVATGKWVCMVCHKAGTTRGYVPDVDLMLEQAMETLDYLSLEKSESWLDQFDSGEVHPYWLSRFSEEACRAFRLGWDGMKTKPCYPIRAMNGKPLGIVHRSLDPDEAKYRYPRGVRKTELLSGVYEARQTDYLFLVEGLPDAVAVREVDHDAIGIYGSLLDPIQVDLIVSLQPRCVYLALDNDKAGNEGSRDAQWKLSRAGVYAERVRWSDRWNDLAEMDRATRSDTLAQALAHTSTER